MVRFKNRHLLVEFIDPAGIAAFPSIPPSAAPETLGAAATADHDDDDDDDDGGEFNVGEDELARIPALPFALPLDPARRLLGEEGASAVFKAVRAMCQSVFGDEGWGRIASSFKVVYHSPLTTLTIMRVARQHYRLLWACVTLLSSVGGARVIPRVVAVSGTIKKLQNAAIVHHRRVTAAAVAALLKEGAKGEAEKETLQVKWDAEREALGRLED